MCEGDFSPNLDNSSTCQTSEPVASGRALQPRAASRHLSQAGAAKTDVHSSSHLRHPKEQSLPTDLLERRVVTLNRRMREQGEGRRSRKAQEDSAPTRIPLALRLSFRLGPNVPALRHSRRPVRGALHLLRSAERSRLRVIDKLSLVPGSQQLNLGGQSGTTAGGRGWLRGQNRRGGLVIDAKSVVETTEPRTTLCVLECGSLLPLWH